MSDYIPLSDAEFDVWQNNRLAIATDNLAAWAIPAADLDAVKTLQAVWANAWAKANNRQNRTAAEVKAKDDAGDNLKQALRSFVSAVVGG
jgi:hypothetical protein